jgi:hypothetical protein
MGWWRRRQDGRGVRVGIWGVSLYPQNARLSNYLVEIQHIIISAENKEEAQKGIENT